MGYGRRTKSEIFNFEVMTFYLYFRDWKKGKADTNNKTFFNIFRKTTLLNILPYFLSKHLIPLSGVRNDNFIIIKGKCK